MAHDRDVAPDPAPPVVASPEAVGGAPMGVDTVLSLQRTAGNRAVGRAIERGLIQRDDKAVALTGVTVTPAKASIPLASGVSMSAAAKPAGATGVKYSLVADKVAPAAAPGAAVPKAAGPDDAQGTID